MNSINNEENVGEKSSALRRYLEANPTLGDLVKFIFMEKRGILAADESGGSIAKKFASMNIADTDKNRRDYRNVFLSTPGMAQYCGGVILFEETAEQKADNGKLFGDFLLDSNILPGIKLDRGLQPLPNFGTADKPATYTRGLDDLPDRLEKYHNMGFRFAKWRAALEITTDEKGKASLPPDQVIDINNSILAMYALECQKAGIIPIVEPELVYDGNYNIETSALATTKILQNLMEKLISYKLDLPGVILKCNMVLAGKQWKVSSTPEEVATATVTVLSRTCPEQLGAVVFLSGGQTPVQAAKNFHAIRSRISELSFPVSFSFARALQDPALNTWKGDNANFDDAQAAFLKQLQKVAS
jgi:fructose-bisphosphate aldolase class I